MTERCIICGETTYFFKHEDWGEEWQEIRATCMEDAARKFARKYNENYDYALMDSCIDIVIKNSRGEIKTFVVSAEQDILYTAIEKDS